MSVYSYDAEEHVKVTLQKSSHKKTVHSIELLKQYGVPYRIAIVYMNDVLVGENTDLYTTNPNKNVIRKVGRGNICILAHKLLKNNIIKREIQEFSMDVKIVSLDMLAMTTDQIQYLIIYMQNLWIKIK